MNTFEEQIKTAIKEIENKTGRELDPENETYLLQTPSAHLRIGIEENDEGEKEFAFNVTGGKLTYLETDVDIFESLYGSEEDYNE